VGGARLACFYTRKDHDVRWKLAEGGRDGIGDELGVRWNGSRKRGGVSQRARPAAPRDGAGQLAGRMAAWAGREIAGAPGSVGRRVCRGNFDI
jgi:hypothetical protein